LDDASEQSHLRILTSADVHVLLENLFQDVFCFWRWKHKKQRKHGKCKIWDMKLQKLRIMCIS